jgi:hypothetical protein
MAQVRAGVSTVRSAVWLAALGLIATGAPARGGDLEFYTGQALFAQCSAKPEEAAYEAHAARCAGYVMGVSDALQALQGAGATPRVCLPASASATAVEAVVARFLADHPDKRPMAAQDLVIEALSAQYPCR